MNDVSPKNNGRIVLIGLLLAVGVGVWYIGRIWYTRHQEEQAVAQAEQAAVNMTDLRFFTPKELLARIERHENLLLVDIRSPESYAADHIVDSVSYPAATLSTLTPGNGQLVVIIYNDYEIDNETLKSIHTLFTDRHYQFGFLQGTFGDWRQAGGSTISSGDPESGLDYSKVIFIEPEEVMRIVDTLASPLFIDVRDEKSYNQSHIPRAINIPLADMEKRRDDIPRQRSLFIYGANELESYQGGVRVFDLGFWGSRVIRGGFENWQSKKFPVTPLPTEAQPK